MLQSIRDKTSGWIAYLIVFLISIPFALWGVNSYLGGGEIPPAAMVNGEEITLQELDSAYANYRRRLAQMFGGSIPEALGNESIMKQQVLTQMIEEFALRSYVDKNNYRIGDERLNQIIRSMDAFHVNGEFDTETYQRQVASLGYSTAGYESELRRTQAMKQLQTGISATAFSIPKDNLKLSALKNQSRTIRIITRPLREDSYEVSQDDISSHFEKHQSRYMTDEQIKIDYIELSLEGVKAGIEVSLDQAQDRYNQSKDAYTSTEARSASHILLSVPADASDSEILEVEERIKEIRLQLDSGVEFAQLAMKHSQDPVSAEEGGNLGEIERGMMVQPFEAALFNLEMGQISQPVKTSFGWHLIQLNAITGGQIQSFDSVRAAIENEIKNELAENQIYDLTENLANLAYEQPDSLLPATEQLGLTLQTSDWFSRDTGVGIAGELKIREAAFSSEVLSQKLNSEAIELADNRIVFIHLNDHKEAASRELDEVSVAIIAEIKQNKSREDNSEAGKAALESLKSGTSMESIASDWNVEIVQPEPLKRSSNEVESEVLSLVFTMATPDAGAVYQGLSHSSGAYSMIELLVVEVDDSSIDDQQLKSFQTSVATQEYQSVIKIVGSRADVVRTPSDELDY